MHLTDDNLCEIYDHRPFVCNLDEIYNKFFKGRMDKKKFYEIATHTCKILQAQEE